MLEHDRRPSDVAPSQRGRQEEVGADDMAPTRRRFSRYRVDLDVTVTSEHNFYSGFIENLSVGGLFIATHQVRPVGELVEFSVTLPGEQEPLVGEGEVRWLRVYSETSHAPPGMGIRFRQIDGSVLERIQTFLAQREPMFYEED